MAATQTQSAASSRSRRARRSAGKASPASPSAPATTFLARERELAELAELLEGERLITLTGAPGIGKSRLALELAGQLADGYASVTRTVELAPISRPADVVRAVASALSVNDAPGKSLTDTLVARLRRRRMLLVLDNCEHVLGACGKLVDALLCGCPELRIVATSREPLGLAGEQVWQVAPLAVPAAEERSPEVLARYPAVALFVERAAAVEPGFSPSPYVAPAVAEICRRLDGIPLALELAAARVESLTAEEIARRLEDRFSLLTHGSPSELARHQTLGAALGWSYELLSEAERALLRRLAVFVGGFELKATAGICAGGQVEAEQVGDLLASLVSKSLVAVDTSSAGTARYRLLETIRAYAGERLEEVGETVALRRAHAGFYLALAEEAEPELTGARQVHWLERLEAERANLRSALEWSLSHGQEEWALRLAGALVLFWRVRCHFSEGRELLEVVVAAGDGASAALQAKALWGAGFMALMAGDAEGAIPLLGKSLACFRELGDRQGCARTLWVLVSCLHQRDGVRVLSLLEESVALARETGDTWCLAHALVLLGSCNTAIYDAPARHGLLEEALAVARNAEDKQSVHLALQALGSFIAQQGDVCAAESLFGEAVAVSGELGWDAGKATVLQRLGQIAFERGDYARAGELLDEALALIRGVGSSLLLPWMLALRARVAHADNNRHRARLLFEESLTLAPEGGPTRIAALRWMGELATEEGDFGAAHRLLEESLELGRERHDKIATAEALHALGHLARAEGETKRAAVLHTENLALERKRGRAVGMIASLEALAGLAAEAGRYEQAARLFGATQALSDKYGYFHSAFGGWPSRSEADLAHVRDGLSPEEFEAALAAGAALSLEEAAAEVSKDRGSVAMPEGGWASLTDIERQVAALVAERMTNQEIAERLFISRGTVKFHLGRIFRKLGFESRTDLAREVRRGEGEPVGSDR